MNGHRSLLGGCVSYRVTLIIVLAYISNETYCEHIYLKKLMEALSPNIFHDDYIKNFR